MGPQALVDPNFGRDNLLHGLSMIVETLLFTLMISVSCQLAYRPMFNAAKRREENHLPPANFYTYYQNVCENFCMASRGGEYAKRKIIQVRPAVFFSC